MGEHSRRSFMRGALTWRNAFLSFVFCLCAASPTLQALDIPPKPSGFVYDSAGLLSETTKKHLESSLYQLEIATSNQVVVAIFPSLEQESLEDYSIRLAEAWKPGQRGKDNGVILLIFKQERLIRIEVGYGLEGALTDAQSGQIIQQVMTPLFREGRFDEGVTAGVAAIAQATRGEYQAAGPSRAGYERPLTPQEIDAMRRQGMLWGAMILVSLFGLFMIDIFRFGTYRHQRRVYKDRYTFWEWFFRFAILLAVLSFIFRMIFYAMLFSRGGSSRGGGFSSGGGSFGGGGASGRW